MEDSEKTKQIVVLLIGPPGSGKSTFCDTVMRSSLRPWYRICQDIINNGKAGTKAQCLKMAISSLKEGKSVFIDRCNLDREQRSEFVKLGGSGIEVHAVVLELPAQVCISRSVKRTGHEGNLQGGRAAAVVNRMLQSKELPKVNEGFSRVMFCYNDADVENAVNTYSKLGLMDTLPSGCFGEKKSDTKSQPGIMKFFKKVNALPGSSSSNEATNAMRKANEKTENFRVSPAKLGSADIVHTLAFPSISTADFQFDLEKASDIIVEKAEEFLPKVGTARLVLVDLSHGSKILSLVKAKASQKNIDSASFFTFVGDITKLRSEGGLHCNVIANATNWRLKPGGGGVNAAIFKASGPDLETATRVRANTLLPGKAVVVPLPSTCPLHNAEGITHVIHVLGPNMNPNRPDNLNNDYTKGCKTLREAYTSLFEGFLSVVQDQSKFPKRSNETAASDSGENIKEHSERNKKYKGSQDKAVVNNMESGSLEDTRDSGKKMSKEWSTWALALHTIAMHPERHENIVLEFSDNIVVINDQYPKARKHVLVLARQESLDGLEDVRKENLQLLQEMHNVGLKWVDRFQNEDASLIFRLGYHSVPSMRQLHLHVISQDFDSDSLKNKKHWNSFTSSFFRDSVDVLEEVKSQGKANVASEDLLKGELRCNRCRSAHPNIPKLKSHVRSCRSQFPEHVLQNSRLVARPET
ncbi:PREDICTED: transcription factor bHLH140 isoform X2 [Camelina sativa]|uniref:Transcription factor bHLH140 isoform X2 n=1 Tax=Camelina sativa TaxID=90675 RepID=A0ABM0XSX9_CAMSA|nr:PREDICTED: transcription factor bHLH140 isoform X2 [Camelina sativa]